MPPCKLYSRASAIYGIAALVLIPSIVLSPVQLWADIYRCVSDDGVVTYSDHPCGRDAKVIYRKYEMSVDDAARRDIIKPGTDRSDMWAVEKDIKDHACQIARIIVPDQRLHYIYIKRDGKVEDEIPVDWRVTVPWGPEEDILNSSIEFYYRGKKNGRLNVWLHSLQTLSDRRPYDPLAMKDVRQFKKAGLGQWEYRR